MWCIMTALPSAVLMHQARQAMTHSSTPSTAAGSLPSGEITALWAAVPYLEELRPQVVEALAAAASCRNYAAGELIFNEGDPCAGLFLIERGVIKITRFAKDGREHILHLLHRGDTFNDVASLDGGPNPASAIAHTDAVVWRIRRADLHRLAESHPDLAWALIESLARRARYLIGLVEDLSMRNVRSRLAHLLLAQAQAAETDEVPRLLTQEEMAGRLGTVREVVGRALRGLAADGIIEFDRHRIVILDPERLAQEAGV